MIINNVMDIRYTLLSFILLTFIFIFIYIIICEKFRIWKLVNYFNSPIENVYITFTKTYLVNKKILYVRVFSSNYTIIHEIAHSICSDIGHTDKFYSIFNDLMNKNKCY